jgi:hypothetical protein
LSGLSSNPADAIASAGAGDANQQNQQKKSENYNKELRGRETTGQGADVITFTNDDYIDAAIGHADGASSQFNTAHQDPFSRQLLHLQMTSTSSSETKTKQKYQPIVVNSSHLRKLSNDDVFVSHRGYGLPNAYYRNMQSSRVSVTMCYSCNKFFRVEDFEFACMKRSGACPFCRVRRDEAQDLLKKKLKKRNQKWKEEKK